MTSAYKRCASMAYRTMRAAYGDTYAEVGNELVEIPKVRRKAHLTIAETYDYADRKVSSNVPRSWKNQRKARRQYK